MPPPATVSGPAGTVEVNVTEPTTFGAMDRAGIAEAERVMRANPGLDYVEIIVHGLFPDGTPARSSGGWTRADMAKRSADVAMASETPRYEVVPASPVSDLPERTSTMQRATGL